jgi:hypothetical protein
MKLPGGDKFYKSELLSEYKESRRRGRVWCWSYRSFPVGCTALEIPDMHSRYPSFD